MYFRNLTRFEWDEVDETLKVTMPKLGAFGKWRDIVPKGTKKGNNISFWWNMHYKFAEVMEAIDTKMKHSDSDEEEHRKERELKKAAKKASKKKKSSKKNKKDDL